MVSGGTSGVWFDACILSPCRASTCKVHHSLCDWDVDRFVPAVVMQQMVFMGAKRTSDRLQGHGAACALECPDLRIRYRLLMLVKFSAGPAAKSVKAQKRARQKARRAGQPVSGEDTSENAQNAGNVSTNGVHDAPSAMQTDAANDQVRSNSPLKG